MYYNPYYTSNLLSMSVVTYKSCVTMDSGVEDSMVVHLENNQDIELTCCGHGIYWFDTANVNPVETPQDKITINKKWINLKYLLPANHLSPPLPPIKNNFNQRKIEGADNSRLLQVRIGWPADQYYKRYLLYNQINNSNSNVDKINWGDDIYGTLVPILQDKTTWRKPQHYAQVTRVPIPSSVLQKHPTYSISTNLLLF